MDAKLKANQKTDSLIQQLVILAQQYRAGSPAVSQKSTQLHRTPLADVSNCNPSGEHSATPKMPRTLGGDSLPHSPCDGLAQKLALFSLGNTRNEAAADESECAASTSTENEPQNDPSSEYWEEEEGEMETIRETRAQLLELGFSEEETQWAIEEAKKKRQSQLSQRSSNGGSSNGGAQSDDAAARGGRGGARQERGERGGGEGGAGEGADAGGGRGEGADDDLADQLKYLTLSPTVSYSQKSPSGSVYIVNLAVR